MFFCRLCWPSKIRNTLHKTTWHNTRTPLPFRTNRTLAHLSPRAPHLVQALRFVVDGPRDVGGCTRLQAEPVRVDPAGRICRAGEVFTQVQKLVERRVLVGKQRVTGELRPVANDKKTGQAGRHIENG